MKLPFIIRNRHILIIDLILILISVFISYVLRLELLSIFLGYYPSMLWMLGLAFFLKPLVYYLFGLYRRMWVYASIQELKLIAIAVTTASAILSVVMLVLFANRVFFAFPRSVLIIDWIVSLIFVGGQRFFLRILSEGSGISGFPKLSKYSKRVLIIGAGDAGAMVVRELQKNPQLNIKPIGFLDDNPQKQKQNIHGVPVIGLLKEMARILSFRRVDEVIIAIPSAPGLTVRRVMDICRKHHIPFRTMPGLYELIGGKVNISRLRDVEISDLLRRRPTQVHDDQVGSILKDKKVLVTGAGGSIGAELCKQIAYRFPKELDLLGHGENSIFDSYLELKERFPNLEMRTLIADVRDKERIDQIVGKIKPDIVFHAAAHKHVPLMEKNIEECILNNIQGTQTLLSVCLQRKVKRFVLISTDKAIRPANVMGASKRIAEMLVLDAAEKFNKQYSVVRFGNVLGSRGSVVPLFKRQIANGGPITVTHPDMKRYFMTIPEAVYLVLQAASMGKGGETFILNMGEQVRIVDLAEDIIRLSGLEPGRDIEIVFTGIREGEKLCEDLWNNGRKFKETQHPDVFYEEGQDQLYGEELTKAVEKLIDLAVSGKSDGILTFFNEIIPDANVKSSQAIEILAIDS